MREDFKRDSLKERLLDKNNLPILEDLLNKEIQKRKWLEELKNKGALDFGLKYSRKELPAILAQVKADVDEFLGTSQVVMPRSDYFTFFSIYGILPGYFLVRGGMEVLVNQSSPLIGAAFVIDAIITAYCMFQLFSGPQYNHLSKKITLRKEKRADIIPIFAHEYAHYLQHRLLFPELTSDHATKEGHARGVERFMANLYKEREDNLAFAYGSNERQVEDLGEMYNWLCRKHGVQPKIKINKFGWFVDDYSIGTTALYIQEALQGNKIFREILEGKFQFANP